MLDPYSNCMWWAGQAVYVSLLGQLLITVHCTWMDSSGSTHTPNPNNLNYTPKPIQYTVQYSFTVPKIIWISAWKLSPSRLEQLQRNMFFVLFLSDTVYVPKSQTYCISLLSLESCKARFLCKKLRSFRFRFTLHFSKQMVVVIKVLVPRFLPPFFSSSSGPHTKILKTKIFSLLALASDSLIS